jgi:hypothetical protein
MLKNLLAMLLVAPLSIPSFAAELRGFDPTECKDDLTPCTCYSQPAIDKIAEQLMLWDECERNLTRYKAFAEEAQKPIATEWYQEPAFIVGGMILTFSTAGVIGYLLGKSK